MKLRMTVNGQEYEVTVEKNGGDYRVDIGGNVYKCLVKDDKVLVSWNGLMIAALAAAYRLLGDDEYLCAAKKCAAFIEEERLVMPDGRLMVRWRDGHAAGVGIIDDYAFYAFGLLELYRASLDAGCLKRAADVAGLMVEDFFDGENGGFYLYAHVAEELISRPKELYDAAMPSGNAVAALVLVRLAALTGEPVAAACPNSPAFREYFIGIVEKLARDGGGDPVALPVPDRRQRGGQSARAAGDRLLSGDEARCARSLGDRQPDQRPPYRA